MFNEPTANYWACTPQNGLILSLDLELYYAPHAVLSSSADKEIWLDLIGWSAYLAHVMAFNLASLATLSRVSRLLVWPVPLAQVWTHYKIGKLNMWTLFCSVCIDFLNSQIWKEIMLELNAKPSSVTTFSTDFSFQNLVFWNLFEFSGQKSLLNECLSHCESKSYRINSIKSCSSRSFKQHQRHIPIPLQFSATI